jgi:hypothetical protein
MITLTFYGLDQFVVGRLSKVLTPNIAKLYEVSEDEVNFFSPNMMVFHNGVEQTSWNVSIHVTAPLKVKVLQEQAAKVILAGIGDVAINLEVLFNYYSQDDRYTKINEEYPRYITEDNLVSYDEDEYADEEIQEGEGEDELYTGDIFEGLGD